ncbi:MAG: GIY-YIG nuclease family protein [Actinomycetota bacterium]
MPIEVPDGARFEAISQKRTAYNKIAIDRNDVIANLELFAHHCGSKQLSSKQYDAWENAIASSSVVLRLFDGSWWNACRAAGLFGKRIPDHELTPTRLAQFMVDAVADPDSNPGGRVPSGAILRAFQEKSGWPIGAKSYERSTPVGMSAYWKALVEAWGEGRPAQQEASDLVLSLGGSEVIVTIPAGLSLAEIEFSRSANVHPDDMLDSLRACAADLSKRSFSINEYAAWKSPQKRGSAGSISKKFGRWRMAMERAGLVASTIFMEDVDAQSLVEHLIAATFDPDANPESTPPGRKQLEIYGRKVGTSYTHYHYEGVYGGIARCWRLIEQWQADEISEAALLSAAVPRASEPGFVYLIQNGDTDEYTIGKTTQTVEDRLKAYRTHNPNPRVIAARRYADVGKKEQELHARYVNSRMGRTEWFKLDEEDVEQLTIELS